MENNKDNKRQQELSGKDLIKSKMLNAEQIKLQEAKLRAQQAELNDRLAKNMNDLKRKIDLFEENVKETQARTPDWLKKRA